MGAQKNRGGEIGKLFFNYTLLFEGLIYDTCMVNFLKFRTLSFQFSNKMLGFRAGIHKMLVTIANREDPEHTASSEAV